VSGAKDAGTGSKKKTLHASERDTPRVSKLRQEFIRQVSVIDPEKLVSVDESGASIALTRTHGRAPKGQRVTGAAPQGHYQMTTMLGAMRASGMAAAMTICAATDTEIFTGFVDRFLAPVLHAGEVVLLDNLSPHKAKAVTASIEAAGASVLFLPPYSPDLNPIEPCWSKVKTSLRAANARTQPDLDAAISKALRSITSHDAKGYFRNSGYIVH
jgi:transposase